MENRTDCTRIQNDIPAYREGWLEPERSRLLDQHLAECAHCRTFADRDARLVQSIADLPVPAAVPTRWEAPLAITPEPRRRLWRPALPASAMAVAAAAALLLVLRAPHPIGPGSVPPGSDMHVGTAEQGAFVVAHLTTSGGGMAGDPNRAMMIEMRSTGSQTP